MYWFQDRRSADSSDGRRKCRIKKRPSSIIPDSVQHMRTRNTYPNGARVTGPGTGRLGRSAKNFRKVCDGVSTVRKATERFGGVRREVVQDVSGPLHLPIVPEADAEVDIHLERQRVLQRQGEEGAGQEGVDELAGERAVLHDADREGIQPARQEDTGIRRDDGRGARIDGDAPVSAPVSFASHLHVRQKQPAP